MNETKSIDADLSRRDLLKAAAITVGGIAAAQIANSLPQTTAAAFAAQSKPKKKTRIHVMRYPQQDAIILESNGRFGIVDSGEDADYPSGYNSRYPWRDGTTFGLDAVHVDDMIAYLKKLGAKPGNVDFYIGTHPHSDHIGTAPRIIDLFKPKTVYTRAYKDSYVYNSDRLWDNLWVYDRLVDAAKRNGCKLITKPKRNTIIKLGDMTIKLLNTERPWEKTAVWDANEMSIVTVVEAFGLKAALMGDADNIAGLEDKLAPLIGRVDVLKAGHHGYPKSCTSKFLHTLKPRAIVVTNYWSRVFPDVMHNLRLRNNALFFTERAHDVGRRATVFGLSAKGLSVDGKLLPKFSKSTKRALAKTNGTAVPYTGLVSINKKLYWFNGSSKSIRSAWKKLGEYWYRFDGHGAMAHGWQKAKGTRYYLDPNSGIMAIGWREIGSHWYWFDKSGAMATGWRLIDGSWEYFNSNGAWSRAPLMV